MKLSVVLVITEKGKGSFEPFSYFMKKAEIAKL